MLVLCFNNGDHEDLRHPRLRSSGVGTIVSDTWPMRLSLLAISV